MRTHNIFSGKKIKVVDHGVDNTVRNGDDAEIFAASRIVQALGGEVRWGSRNEDGRKIDLFCSYDHPYPPTSAKERTLTLIQIKSGPTYGEKLPNGFKLKGAAKTKAKRATHPLIIVWVDRIEGHIYWAFVHSATFPGVQRYGEHHKLSPASRYDFVRCLAKFLPASVGGKGLILKEYKASILKEKRKLLKEHYKRNREVYNPTFGKIECTKIAWRHMYRRDRSEENKKQSDIIIPYLGKILVQNPTSLYECNGPDTIIEKEVNGFTHRSCEFTLQYDSVQLNIEEKRVKIRVNIRIVEEIRWPSGWMDDVTYSQRIDRRVILLSSHFKKIKDERKSDAQNSLDCPD
jgi:hypothetical protein